MSANSPQLTRHTPIGFWLKHTDNVITEYTAKALSQVGLNRFGWQVLKMLHDAGGSLAKDQLWQTEQAFMDCGQFERLLEDLRGKHWLDLEGAQVKLTTDGESAYNHAWAVQQQTRATFMKNISEDDYLHVLKVLEQVCRNLGDPAFE